NDTVFLAELVGEAGKVYGFDIQEEAIVNTTKALQEHNFRDRVIIKKASHEFIDEINETIKCAMFNLGYLPKGDQSIVTHPSSTIPVIKSCIELLQASGLIFLCIYTSHLGGLKDATLVEEYLKNIDSKSFKVLKFASINEKRSPYLILIYRIRQ